MPPGPGQHLPHYRIGDKLGDGDPDPRATARRWLWAVALAAGVAGAAWGAPEDGSTLPQASGPRAGTRCAAPPLDGPSEHLLDAASDGFRARRACWQDRGFQALALYTGDGFHNLRGGVSRGSRSLGNLDLLLDVDAERAFGWRGTSFFAYVLGNHGRDPSERVGDAQVMDNIAAPSTVKLYELWGEVRITKRLSVLAGLYDVNSEFDVIESSRDFINSSFGIGPDFSQSGANGPSIFPTTSLGIRASFQPGLHSYLHVAVLDGVSGDPDDPDGTQIILGENDGVLLVVEGGGYLDAAKDHPPESRDLKARRIGRGRDWSHGTKIGLGVWGYSERQDTIALDAGDVRRRRSWGAYLLGETRLRAEPGSLEQGLDVFGRIGVAEDRVNRFGGSLIAGLSYTGLFPARDEDRLGLAVAVAENGDPYKASLTRAGVPVSDAETVVELTYVAHIRPWLQVQPDLQYVVDPGTDPRLDDALVAGLRVVITF